MTQKTVKRSCKVCKEYFAPQNCQLKRAGWGLYCSRKCKGVAFMGKKNSEWLGDAVGYHGIHKWIKRHFGKASHCMNKDCFYPRKVNKGTVLLKAPKRYEWANLSGKYRRNISDWTQLCPSCHRKYDLNLISLTI